MSTNRNTTGPIHEGDEFDWRWVGEPESWMGLRSARTMTRPQLSGAAAGQPHAGRFAVRLVRSFLALFNV
jgi:hypothetical protein